MARAYECDLCGVLVKDAPTFHKVTTIQPSSMRQEHKFADFHYTVVLSIEKTWRGHESTTMEVCDSCMAKAIAKAAAELPKQTQERSTK